MIVLLLLASCCEPKNELIPPAPDYSDCSNWFGNPSKENKHRIDIFYVYPTIIFTSINDRGDTLYYFDTENKNHRILAQKIQRQYEVIYADTLYNFYAPLYRQVALETFDNDNDYIMKKMQIPISDITGAFQYYMDNFNNGRPFFLIGHSQGAILLIELLKNTLTEEQRQRMIASYVFGFQITQEELENYPTRLLPAKDSNDVHCIVLLNCASDTNSIFPLASQTVVGINPLNWKTDHSLAPALLHQGYAQYDSEHETCSYIPNYTCSYLWKHHLICPDVDPKTCYNEKIKFLPYGNLHLLDPLLFAKDIKMNMLCRERQFRTELNQ